MSVRHATMQDKIAVIRLLKEFHREAGEPYAFQAVYMEQLFLTHAMRPDACCLISGQTAHGVLIARVFDHPFGWGKWAQEIVWFVTKARRGRVGLTLLNAYEAWAKEQGCVATGLATRPTNDVSSIYRRRGYAAFETHFMRVL